MDGWTQADLARIGGSWQIEIASEGEDGEYGRPVPIWVVRVGQRLYVRSSHGPRSGWFGHADKATRIRITTDGVGDGVALAEPRDPETAVDSAYHAKYDVTGAAWIADLVSDRARSTTRELLPRR